VLSKEGMLSRQTVEEPTVACAFHLFHPGMSEPVSRYYSMRTDLMGSTGVKNYGGFDMERLIYVVEFGAGSF
jgi:hypothetical protein